MHDDRTLVEARIDRILRERVRPAVYGESAPLQTEVWHAPGEPVPAAEGIAATYRGAAGGTRRGARPWRTSWFHVTGTVPAAWAGRAVEAVIDLGFARGAGRVSAEGLVHRPDGTR